MGFGFISRFFVQTNTGVIMSCDEAAGAGSRGFTLNDVKDAGLRSFLAGLAADYTDDASLCCSTASETTLRVTYTPVNIPTRLAQNIVPDNDPGHAPPC